MYLADGATQALGGLRDNDQVNMIGHQAICPDRDLLCAAESRDELEVVLVIFLTEERLLSAVSPLGDMVGHARSYHTCQSSHGGKLTRPQPRVKSCRVEVWRGGLGRCLCSLLARSFVCGCHIISTMLRFHTPLIKPGGRFSRTRLSDKAC